MGHKEKPIVINAIECKECNVPKGWGHEIIFENNDKYCGKLLCFKQGAKFSMHYHLIKDETWYVDEGEFLYRWIDTETADVNEVHLKVGDTVRQRPGQPHQLEALTDGVVFEVSTEHFDEDSYRVWRGDSQKKTRPKDGKHFFSPEGDLINVAEWEIKDNAMEQGAQYGWQGAMAYGNLIKNELNSFGPGVVEGDIYLDLGANIGMSAIRAESCGASKIYCVEPDPGVFKALEMNKSDNWVIDNVAISNKDGILDIPKWPDWWDLEPRPAITLESFFKKHNIDYVDYMKVDIEGHEHNIMKDVPQYLYDKINKIFIEYHEPDENREEQRINFVEMMINKGYSSHHVDLGQYQSFLYFWKS